MNSLKNLLSVSSGVNSNASNFSKFGVLVGCVGEILAVESESGFDVVCDGVIIVSSVAKPVKNPPLTLMATKTSSFQLTFPGTSTLLVDKSGVVGKVYDGEIYQVVSIPTVFGINVDGNDVRMVGCFGYCSKGIRAVFNVDPMVFTSREGFYLTKVENYKEMGPKSTPSYSVVAVDPDDVEKEELTDQLKYHTGSSEPTERDKEALRWNEAIYEKLRELEERLSERDKKVVNFRKVEKIAPSTYKLPRMDLELHFEEFETKKIRVVDKWGNETMFDTKIALIPQVEEKEVVIEPNDWIIKPEKDHDEWMAKALKDWKDKEGGFSSKLIY